MGSLRSTRNRPEDLFKNLQLHLEERSISYKLVNSVLIRLLLSFLICVVFTLNNTNGCLKIFTVCGFPFLSACKDLLCVWRGVVWCGVVWCGVVWCGVVWCG